ncbi:MAG TPA: PIG-L family deacetylase [Bryobacteraceae bacterium]|nr:PIG-L family deacetylase [Bryobacteraceae bacterium]
MNRYFRIRRVAGLFVFAAAILQSKAGRPFAGRVLVVVTCHADDFSIFAGGSIQKLIDQGYTGYLVRVTDDEKSGGPDPQHNAAQNDREVREVAHMLGLRAVYSLNFKNDELGRVPHDRLRDAIMGYLRQLKADTIYTFDPYATYGEENPDHLATGRAAEDAARNAGNSRYSPEQIRSGIAPHRVTDAYYWSRAPIDVNAVTDISAYLDRKMEALAHQHAQFPPSVVSYFREHDEDVGRIYGMKAAEVSHHIRYDNSPAEKDVELPHRANITPWRPVAPPGLTSFKGKVVVVISPHAMDYVRAAGGTIAKAVREGATVYLVRLTDDERHGGADSRVQNRLAMADATRKAARILGIRQVIDLDLKDGEVAEVAEPELRARFAAIFRALAPDAIFTADPWAPYDRELDDARIGHAAEDAAWSASHLSFYPELALMPKTDFKVIINRYFWTGNGGEQASNYQENIASVTEMKARALQVFGNRSLGEQPPSTTESFYYYHAANPLDWFADWLAASPAAHSLPGALRLTAAAGAPKKALVIAPELADWLASAGATVRQMIRDGYEVSLVSLGDGSKSTIPTERLGLSRVIQFGFRDGELSSVPPLILRHRLMETLRLLSPDTVLMPDPWEHYTTHESVVAGDVGSDAIYEWTLQGAAGRILYWEHNRGTRASEQFHVSRFGKRGR